MLEYVRFWLARDAASLLTAFGLLALTASVFGLWAASCWVRERWLGWEWYSDGYVIGRGPVLVSPKDPRHRRNRKG